METFKEKSIIIALYTPSPKGVWGVVLALIAEASMTIHLW
jgi:S-adenosylmethionine/arginine decarboxylase-like enzyme